MVEWLGVLWAWIVDPAYMADLRQERIFAREERKAAEKAALAVRFSHRAQMSMKGTHEWSLTCSCGWQRMAFYAPKEAKSVRNICDAHERGE